MAGLQGVKIVQAALGGWHCLALDDNGQVHAWGGNEYAQCDEQVSTPTGGDSREAQVWWGHVVMRPQSCVLPTVHCMDQQPSHSMNPHCAFPAAWCQVPARDLLVPQPCMPQLRVAQVACGGMSSMVLTTSGDVWTWGEPWGDFTLDISRTPRKVRAGRGLCQEPGCGVVHKLCMYLPPSACTPTPTATNRHPHKHPHPRPPADVV